MRNDLQLLELLLKDQSLSSPESNSYISWATDDYSVTDADKTGDHSPFSFNAQITPELVSHHQDLIQPRIKKTSIHADLTLEKPCRGLHTSVDMQCAKQPRR